jgi:ankyrin repeat protein
MLKCKWCGKEFQGPLLNYCSNRCKYQAAQSRKTTDTSKSNDLPGWLTLIVIVVLIWGLFFGKCNESNQPKREHNQNHKSNQESVKGINDSINNKNVIEKIETQTADTIPKVAFYHDDKCVEKYGEDFVSYCEDGDIDNAVKIFDMCNEVINFQNSNNSRTALIESSDHNRLNIVEFLLENNVDIDISDEDGRSPLIEAVDRECQEIVNILLANGANVNKQEKHGNTALIIAIDKKNVPIVNSLMQRSPDLNLMNNNGKSALELGKRIRNKEIREIFKNIIENESKL